MKEPDVTERDRKTIRTFGRAALFIAAIVLVLAIVGVLAEARAHGDYDWINKGKYRSGSGELCCGKDDCYEIAKERVHEVPEGYRLPDHNISVPYRQAIPSEDGKYWICKVGARMRCFFAPLSGF